MASTSSDNVSDNVTDIAGLLNLQRAGYLSASEFVRLASEMTRNNVRHNHSSPCEERGSSSEDGSLVGEDGLPFSPHGHSSPVAGGAPLSVEGSPGQAAECLSVLGSPLPAATPAGSQAASDSGDVQPDPSTWPANTKVTSSEHGEVLFLRVGNEADFVNNGRARIKYWRVKKNTKNKKEEVYTWVQPGTLTLLEELLEMPPPDSPRKSPRIEGCTTAGQAAAELLPARAEIERARKLPMKALCGERGRQHATRTTKESLVTIEQRIAEFPGHSLAKVDGKLCCVACPFFMANKWSSINSHCQVSRKGQPTKHARKLEAWKVRTVEDNELKTFLLEYFEAHPGETMGSKDTDELLYRYRVAESFVAYPPFAAIDHHKRLLQRAGYSVPDATNPRLFIPKIEQEENKLLDKELASGNPVPGNCV